MPEYRDAIVIGGGPAGATFATLAAQAGRTVLVLERERFPRFHIGESLLPVNNDLFQRLGVLEALMDRGRHIRKYAATFMDATGERSTTFRFDNALGARHIHAFHVERAEFDHLLLERARAAGADVRERWTVTELLDAGDRVTGVAADDPDGRSHTFSASVVVDASGRDTFIAGRRKLRRPHPSLRKAALFGHFEGVPREAGEAAGNLKIVAFEDGWAWVIPFASGRTSVGLVLHGDRFKQRGGDLEAFWDDEITRAPALAALMAEAERVGPLHAVPSMAYTTDQWAGDGWVTVGDAAVFIDPVFSTGVLLAMRSAAQVADIVTAEAGPDWHPTAATFAPYERRIRRQLRELTPFIEGFYDPAFLEQFMNPRDILGVRRAITALLAGDFRPRWTRRLRRAVFWLGVRHTRRTLAKAGLPIETTIAR